MCLGLMQPADFVASLAKPRKIVILVMAGKPVDDTIEMLSNFMEVSNLRVVNRGVEGDGKDRSRSDHAVRWCFRDVA